MLAFIVVATASVMWPLVTRLAFHPKSSISILNTICHHTNWWLMGTDFPSGRTSNAILAFSISLDIASADKVLPFLASRAQASSSILGSSIPNLLCCLLMLEIILSLFFEHVLNLLGKSWFLVNPLYNGKPSCLHKMRFF